MNINRFWRAFGTLLSFTIFGIGGIFIGLFITPCLLIVRNTERRQKLARGVIRLCFKSFIHIMKGLGVLDYKVHHIEKLQRPGLLILANHPSLIDVIFLLAHTPYADCVVKGRLASNPFTRGPIRSAGYITNHEPEAIMEVAGESLKKGNSLILFPEGTRTVPGRPIKFRRGGANIAIRTDTPITPVIFRCTPATLTKGKPWYHIPSRKVWLELHVLDDLPPDHRRPMRATGQEARKLTKQLSDYFNWELERLDNENRERPIT